VHDFALTGSEERCRDEFVDVELLEAMFGCAPVRQVHALVAVLIVAHCDLRLLLFFALEGPHNPVRVDGIIPIGRFKSFFF